MGSCRQCGLVISDGSKYCPRCGNRDDVKRTRRIANLGKKTLQEFEREVYNLVQAGMRLAGQGVGRYFPEVLPLSRIPLKRKAEISYAASTGICVKTGYEVPGFDRIVFLNEFIPMREKSFIQFAGRLYRRPRIGNWLIRNYIESGKRRIATEDTSRFFEEDFPVLKKYFKLQLLGVTIENEPLVPFVQLGPGKEGWLEFNVEYKVGNYRLPANLFAAGEKSDVVHIENGKIVWAKIDKAAVVRLREQIRYLGILPSKDGMKLQVKETGGFRSISPKLLEFLENVTEFRLNPDFALSESAERDLQKSAIVLKPYQRQGIHWLTWLFEFNLNGILADDMGLGKTIQTAIAIRLAYEKSNDTRQSLVICPKSLIRHWHRELERVHPQIPISEYIGANRNKKVFSSTRPVIHITTYDTLANDIDEIKSTPFFFVVLDEGNMIKNPYTQRSRSARMLSSAHKLVLSGTPIENRPAELWPIFNFLMRDYLGPSYRFFVKEFDTPIVRGDRTRRDELSRKIRPLTLRRLKEQVAPDLPDKTDRRYYCHLTEEQRSLYGQIIERASGHIRSYEAGEEKERPTVLQVLPKLKMLCDHPALINDQNKPLLGRSEKFDFTAKKLVEIVEAGEGVLVFSQYLRLLELLEEWLKGESIDYIRIDGSTSTKKRQNLIDSFNNGDALVALLSVKATGYGVNLAAANHVIHFDRWWNQSVEDQATDRAHRIGQTRTVYVHKIICRQTLEEKIDRLIEKKREISGKIILDTIEKISLMKEELLDLVRPI
jgi:SNF2 family DNA or RNA helicase